MLRASFRRLPATLSRARWLRLVVLGGLPWMSDALYRISAPRSPYTMPFAGGCRFTNVLLRFPVREYGRRKICLSVSAHRWEPSRCVRCLPEIGEENRHGRTDDGTRSDGPQRACSQDYIGAARSRFDDPRVANLALHQLRPLPPCLSAQPCPVADCQTGREGGLFRGAGVECNGLHGVRFMRLYLSRENQPGPLDETW